MLKSIGKARVKYTEWTTYKEGLKQRSFWIYHMVDLVETVLFAVVVVLILRKFIIQTSLVPTGSMIPTLNIRDRLFVNKFIYDFKDPQRGDIVVFRSPADDGKEYVKRCIGVPGDRLSIQRGIVYINGESLVFGGVIIQHDDSDFPETTIPNGHYFMMGDNRANSSDSRIWGFLPEDDVLGKAWFTFWPFGRMRVLQ